MLYLTKSPDGSSAIIRATDEAHLWRILDEELDPGDVTFEVYDGPLRVDFPVPEDSSDWCEVGNAAFETGHAMVDAARGRALPGVLALLNAAADEERDFVPAAEMRAAIEEDRLQPLRAAFSGVLGLAAS